MVPTASVGSIIWGDVLITSEETLRFSVDGSQTFVKYDGSEPESVALIPDVGPVLNHEEMGEILQSQEWSPDDVD